jgi:hypothetical protein
MKYLISIILLGLFICCSKSDRPIKPNKVIKPIYLGNNFTYEFELWPAFHAPSSVEIVKNNDSGYIKFSIDEFFGQDSISEIKMMSKDDFKNFFKVLDTISLLEINAQAACVDGITVRASIFEDSLTNWFDYCSPEKQHDYKEYQVTVAIIGLLWKKFNKFKQQEYLETLEGYFEFGNHFRITKKQPFEIRIYGHLYFNELLDFAKLDASIPLNQPILIDMTNFERMDTMYYPLFQNLIKKNNKIIWIAKKNEEPKKQLIELGISQDKVFYEIKKGRAYIKKNYGDK